MIRTLWAALNSFVATVLIAPIVIGAALVTFSEKMKHPPPTPGPNAGGPPVQQE